MSTLNNKYLQTALMLKKLLVCRKHMVNRWLGSVFEKFSFHQASYGGEKKNTKLRRVECRLSRPNS